MYTGTVGSVTDSLSCMLGRVSAAGGPECAAAGSGGLGLCRREAGLLPQEWAETTGYGGGGQTETAAYQLQ